MDMYRVETVISGIGVQGGGFANHYLNALGGTAAAACAAVNAFWAYNSAIFVTGLVFTVQSAVDVVTDTTGAITSVSAGTQYTVTGTGGTAQLSPATQGLIQWRTGVYSSGREIRGRTFLPGMVEAQTDVGVPNAGLLSAMNTMAAQYMAAANSEPVVWRRPRKAADPLGVPGQPGYRPGHTARPGVAAALISGTGWSKFAVLRSRRD